MNTEIVSDIIIFFGAMFSLVLFIGQLVLKNRTFNNVLLSILFFAIAIFQFSNSFTIFYKTNEWYSMYQIIYPLSIISFFFIGPLQYFYFKTLAESNMEVKKSFYIHFLPGIASIALLFLFRTTTINFNIPHNLYRSYLNQNNEVYSTLAQLSVGFFICYCIIMVKKFVLLYFRKHSKKKRELKITVAIISLLLFIVLLWPIHTYFAVDLLKVIHSLLTLYIVMIYTLSNRYPQYIHILKIETQRDHYIRSQVEGLNVESVIEKLTDLMEYEKLHCHEDLTVQSLASELEITSHQLSEILNLWLGKTFYTYINELRIKEAELFFENEPDRSVLSIAHAVGFNSTSSFYGAFKKFTGQSPTAFKKQVKK